jgi:branched-chain amino acid transport system ATP-binding protein
MGLWRASQGRIQFAGESIAGLDTPAIARRGIAFVPENMGLFTDLTVHENLVLAARSGPLDKARLDWLLGLFPPLRTFWSLPAGNLSGGQKQMLAVARALVEPRRLILIDEPTKGLAPAIVKAMTAAIAELKRTNTTILLVEQNFAMAREVGDTVAVMDDGRIVHTGAMSALAADAGLQNRLMGLSLEAHQ